MRVPSRSGAALFSASRSASPVIPPAASKASRTREPAGRWTTPGRATAPATSTRMTWGVGSAVGCGAASTTGGSSRPRATNETTAPPVMTTAPIRKSQARILRTMRRPRGRDEWAVRPGRRATGPPRDRSRGGRRASWSVRAPSGLGRSHLDDRHRKAAGGLAIDLEVEPVRAERREAQVVELDDDVHVLAGDRVDRDLRSVGHRLPAVRLAEPHDDRMRPGVQTEDRDQEHPGMLGRKTGHADVPEDPEDADLAVLADERVVAQGGEADLRSHPSVTTFTSLSATTMSRSICLPPMA